MKVVIGTNEEISRQIAEEFIKELKSAIIKQIGEKPHKNEEYCKLINYRAYQKIEEEANLYKDRIYFGGEGDPDTCKYDPTIIYPVKNDEPNIENPVNK